MKNTALVLAFVMLFSVLQASENAVSADVPANTVASQETITVYDVYSHEDLAANVLLGWGGVSFVSGGIMAFTGDNFSRGMGIQNMLWGATDAGIALWIKNTEQERKGLRGREEEEKWFRDLLALNFFIDFAYIAVGTGMLAWGNDDIKGHGAGIITQGLFLLTFDGVNWVLSNNLGQRYQNPQ